jgi:diguanylate cyclase (GGDEF)-like protein/PAS domain S-box-containing protein
MAKTGSPPPALAATLAGKRSTSPSTTPLSTILEQAAGLRKAQLMAKLAHVVTAPDGSFESWSETLPDLIGVKPADIVRSTRKWLDLIHPNDKALFRDTALAARAHGTRVDVEYRLRRSDGAWIHLRQVMEPIAGQADPAGRLRWFNTLQDVTEQREAENKARESERRFSDMLARLELVSVMLDRDARVTYCNDYLLRLIGWGHDEVVGRNWLEDFIPPDAEDVKEVFAALLADRPAAWHHENEILTRDGKRRLIRWNNSVLRSDSGEVIGTASIGEDITERKQAEIKIRRLNRVHAVLSGINTLIVRAQDRQQIYRETCRIAVEHGEFRMAWIGVVDRESETLKPVASDGDVRGFLDAAEAALSRSAQGRSMAWQAMRGKSPVICNDVQNDARTSMKDEYRERGINSLAMLPLIVEGEGIGVVALYAAEPSFFDDAEMKLLLELAGDISFGIDHIQKAERIDYLAYYDGLTGLANRTLFHERLDQQVTLAKSEGRPAALVEIDIERFKVINDSLGRQAGDGLLKEIAGRLRAHWVEPAQLGRLGADHFGVMLPDAQNAEEAARRIEKGLQEVFGPPFRTGATELRVSAKAGIAMFPADGADPETLFRNSEAALKKAKASAEKYLFYTEHMTERVAEKLSLENRLRQALEREEFVLYYQPQVELEGRRIVALEALIRWQSPDLGLVQPAEFIPMLEETGLILPVGEWTLKRAALDLNQWLQQGILVPPIAVNVSAVQMRQRDFVDVIRKALSTVPLPARLDLEITESLLMEDLEENIVKLRAVRKLGVRIAIDDFGTGYSSLAYLAKLPVESLKIDRSFVATMLDDPNTMNVIHMIISLARSMRLTVVAEGVESEEQAKMLRLLRCDQMQGFLFSRPLPAADVAAMLPRAFAAR